MESSRYIICCMCGDTPSFSKDSFKILFPYATVPPVELQPNLYNFLNELKRDTNFYNYVRDNLIDTKSKYSYYFEVDEDGNVIAQWDLLKGIQVL